MTGDSEKYENKEEEEAKEERDLEEKVRELEEKLDQEEKKSEDYLNQLKYVKADFENYKKRAERESREETRQEVERFVTKFLEVLDNLERALESARHSRKKKPLVEGIEMVHDQFLKLLEEEGLEEIEAQECEFDPNEHECITVEEGEDGEEEKVIEVFQKGYKFRGRVIRHAKVKIAR